MKSLFLVAVAAIAMCAVGCKKIPDAETVGQKAYTAGLAAGYAAALIPNISAEDKTNVVAVITIAEQFIPKDGKSISETWEPVINNAILELIRKEKLTESQAILVRSAAGLAMSGIDYLFNVHPKWVKDATVVEVAIHQLCDGFRTGVGINPNVPEVVELVTAIMDKDAFAACMQTKQ